MYSIPPVYACSISSSFVLFLGGWQKVFVPLYFFAENKKVPLQIHQCQSNGDCAGTGIRS